MGSRAWPATTVLSVTPAVGDTLGTVDVYRSFRTTRPPITGFMEVSPLAGQAPLDVTATVTMFAGAIAPLVYDWDVPGSPGGTDGDNPHAMEFEAEGVWNVLVTVTDASLRWTQFSADVTATTPLPTALLESAGEAWVRNLGTGVGAALAGVRGDDGLAAAHPDAGAGTAEGGGPVLADPAAGRGGLMAVSEWFIPPAQTNIVLDELPVNCFSSYSTVSAALAHAGSNVTLDSAKHAAGTSSNLGGGAGSANVQQEIIRTALAPGALHPVTPTPPEGATLELEYPTGVPSSLELRVDLRSSANGTPSTGGVVLQMPHTMFVVGSSHLPRFLTTADLAAGAVRADIPAAATAAGGRGLHRSPARSVRAGRAERGRLAGVLVGGRLRRQPSRWRHPVWLVRERLGDQSDPGLRVQLPGLDPVLLPAAAVPLGDRGRPTGTGAAGERRRGQQRDVRARADAPGGTWAT